MLKKVLFVILLTIGLCCGINAAYAQDEDNPQVVEGCIIAPELVASISSDGAVDSAQEFTWLAEHYRLDDNFEQSILCSEYATVLYPDYADAYENLAKTYTEMEDYDQAIPNWDRLVELEPGRASYFQRAFFNVNRKEYALAIPDFGWVIAFEPDNASAYNERGLAYYRLGEYDHAIVDCSRAVALKPDYADAYRYRGLAHDALREYALAVADYTSYIEAGGENWLTYAYFRRGLSQLNLDNYEQSIADNTITIERSPEYKYAYNNRGYTYYLMEEYEKAIADYSKALELDPTYVTSYNNRAHSYRAMGAYDLAIADYTSIIALGDNDAYYITRAYTYGLMGDTQAALQDSWQWVTSAQNERIDETPLQLGQSVTLEETRGRFYYIPLDIPGGTTINILADHLYTGVDPFILILTEDGEPVAVNDDATDDDNRSVLADLTLPDEGTYTLVVGHAWGGFEGQIQVTVAEEMPAFSEPPAEVETPEPELVLSETYTNERLGLTVNYPADWAVEERAPFVELSGVNVESGRLVSIRLYKRTMPITEGLTSSHLLEGEDDPSRYKLVPERVTFEYGEVAYAVVEWGGMVNYFAVILLPDNTGYLYIEALSPGELEPLLSDMLATVSFAG
jgi:tetratricopeptide (TPR) repeat protein